MRWIANKNNPPKYVWHDDEWFNESDKKTYKPNFDNHMWESREDFIPFPKNTTIFPDNK